MSQASVEDLTRRASDLSRIAGSMRPDDLAPSIADARRALGEPLGDPGGLDELLHAFNRAVQGLDGAQQDSTAMAVQRLPAIWTGQAADAATGALTASTKELETDTAIFTAASKLLASVADSVRSAHQEHNALQQYLLDLQNKAEALPPDAAISPAAADLAAQARDAVHNAAELLTKIRTEDAETANKLKSVSSGPLGPIAFLASVSGGQRKPIEEILREYQVTPDPEGMVTFPDGPLGWLAEQFGLEPQEMTAGEAELLSQLGPMGIKDAYDIYSTAKESGETAFGGQGERDGHADAYRHAYWNALLTQRFGAEWTESYTTAHERLGGKDQNAATVEAMDLYNNEVGRRIAAENPDASPEELGRKVEEAVRNGELLVHDRGAQLTYSDQTPVGQTGFGTGPRDLGGHDPKPADDTSSTGYNPTPGENGRPYYDGSY